MMRQTLPRLCLLALVAWTAAHSASTRIGGTASLFSRAIGLALSGHLDGTPEAHALVNVLKARKNPAEMAHASFLLSYLEKVPESERAAHIDSALAYPQLIDLIGRHQVARLYRFRADNYFRGGKFAEAKTDFGHVLELGDAAHQEYAILKMGWCDLNQDLPGTAFSFWINVAEHGPVRARVLGSPSFWQGLGQAYAENPERNPVNLSQVRRSLDKREWADWFLEGVRDGIENLAPERLNEAWLRELARLPGGRDFLLALSSSPAILGSAACHVLAVGASEVMGLKLSSSTFGQVAESCIRHRMAETSQGLDGQGDERALKRNWDNAIARVEWLAQARSQRLSLWLAQGDSQRACSEGVQWIADVPTKDEQQSIPLADFSNWCRDPSQLREAISEYPERFRDSDDAFYQLALAVSASPEGQARWRAELMTHPARYRETLFPDRLSKLWLAAIHGGAKPEAMAIAHWVEEFPQPVLEQYLLSLEVTELVRRTKEENSPAVASDIRAFFGARSNKLSAEHFMALARSAIHLKDWALAETLLVDGEVALPATEKKQLMLVLLAAALAGEYVVPPASPAGTITQLGLAYAALTERNLSALAEIDWLKGTSLDKDTQFLRRHAEQLKANEAKKGSGLVKAKAWATAEVAANRRISERKWAHQVMLGAARKQVTEFCTRLTKRIEAGELAQSGTELPQTDWLGAVAQLEGRLKDCANQGVSE